MAVTRLRGGAGKSAPPTPDLQNVSARFRRQQGQHALILVRLGPLQSLVMPVEQRRRIGHRAIQPELVETIPKVVVSTDIPPAAPTAVGIQQVPHSVQGAK